MYFQDCSDFCELWDQKSFDPNYDTKSVDFFTPMVEEVFARKPYDPKYIKHSKREPLVKIIN
jgi:predicted HD phosphohydrolase